MAVEHAKLLIDSFPDYKTSNVFESQRRYFLHDFDTYFIYNQMNVLLQRIFSYFAA